MVTDHKMPMNPQESQLINPPKINHIILPSVLNKTVLSFCFPFDYMIGVNA